jgi:hypothetical protein
MPVSPKSREPGDAAVATAAAAAAVSTTCKRATGVVAPATDVDAGVSFLLAALAAAVFF